MMRYLIISLFLLFQLPGLEAREGYWQQRIYCQMEVDFDVKTHRYTGSQRLVYTNNSPDSLRRMFYHLYYNAFQPGSEMDLWSQRLPDPTESIVQNLPNMSPEDIGFMQVTALSQNNVPVRFRENRTILEVWLDKPIAPGESAILDMEFQAQTPKLTRRAGRDSQEGIAYSMAQWFPKVCNYDHRGWHAHPYVQREFYGVWGDYDVKISIDREFVLGGSGYIQNPQEVGSGYEDPEQPLLAVKGNKKTWHFFAPNVHDFMWAADPHYKHVRRTMHDGTEFHFLYVENKDNKEAWEALPGIMDTAFYHVKRLYGAYPYKQYSIIHGGDGGMEYPMATLITGNRPLRSLVGVSVHELLHMWYQMMLGFNESYYAWMDEGFTNYASSEIMALLFPQEDNYATQRGNYQGYLALATSGVEEPLATHSDHFLSNFAYGAGVYNKGAVFLHQLGYVIGKEALDTCMLLFYDKWRFQHPTDMDFIRVVEKHTGIELDWYLDYWIHTTRTIDYGLDTVWLQDGQLHVQIRNEGTLPMPIDLAVRNAEGTIIRSTIPLDIMRGSKRMDALYALDYLAEPWAWTAATYTLILPGPWPEGETLIAIDPSRRLADINIENNLLQIDLGG